MKKVALLFLIYYAASIMTMQCREKLTPSQIGSIFEERLKDDVSIESQSLLLMYCFAAKGLYSSQSQSFWTTLEDFSDATTLFDKMWTSFAVWNSEFYN